MALLESQRRWLAYRDAWGRFGEVHYPKTSAQKWKAWITRQRIDRLLN